MLNIFVDPSEIVEIRFAVGLTSESKIVADESKEKLQELYGELSQVENHLARFKKPGFGDQQRIAGDAMKLEGGDIQVNYFAFRKNLLASLLKEWTLTTAKPTQKDVDTLHPMIANVMALLLEEELRKQGLI
jgi:hypothetical protein